MERSHRITAERIAIDSTPVAGGKPCTCCGRVKPVSQFYASRGRLRSQCKRCYNINQTIRDESPERQLAKRVYHRRDDVRARYRAAYYVRHEENKERMREYRRTERGRLVACRIDARQRLRRAATPEQRARIQSLIDRHTAALAALDAEDE